jgi:hypothetical protein
MNCLRKVLLSSLLLSGIVWANPDSAGTEIEYLLQTIGNSNCTFIRNGSEHSSTDAESHLRKKYSHAGKRIDTAEKFVGKLATQSSISGKPYELECQPGKTEPVSEWLLGALADYRLQTNAP